MRLVPIKNNENLEFPTVSMRRVPAVEKGQHIYIHCHVQNNLLLDLSSTGDNTVSPHVFSQFEFFPKYRAEDREGLECPIMGVHSLVNKKSQDVLEK